MNTTNCETGLFYIRQKGGLYYCQSNTQITTTSANCPTLVKPLLLYEQQKLPTLLDICVDTVAINLSWVESLEGLPDIIGKLIFQTALHRGVFQDIDTESSQALHLFNEAYDTEAISSLNLKQCQLLCAEIGEYADKIFSSITILDLTSSKLGDGHDIINHIAQLHGYYLRIKYIECCYNTYMATYNHYVDT